MAVHPAEPLAVEVLTPLLAVWGGPRARAWTEARTDYFRLWQLLDAVSNRFHSRITVYIVDPVSFQGLFKITRHRIRRFPTFLIGGREKYSGWDLDELSRRIEARLQSS
jgi:hypothetical protein